MRILRGVVGLIFMCSVSGFAGDKIVYESVTSGVSTKSEWDLEKELDQILVKGMLEGSNIEMNYSPSFALLQYVEKTTEIKELDVAKQGPCLIIRGVNKGKEKIKSHKVGDTPWVQDFKFGFTPFLKDKIRSYSFYIVNPDNLDVHEMVATKEIEESLEVEGHQYDTQKIKITLKGFRRKFWTGYAWFDKTSNLMVKYRANKGPGTPYTEVLLVKSTPK